MGKKKEDLIDKLGNIEWKLIKLNGECCDHMISPDGQILKCGGYENTKRGPVYHPEKLIVPFVGAGGNLQVTLRFKGKSSTHFLHTLLANAFIPNPKHLTNVRHINEDKLDNRLENLEWCVPIGLAMYNSERYYKKKADKHRDTVSKFIYTEEEMLKAIELLEESRLKDKEIYNITGVHPSTIADLKNENTWANISKCYKLPNLFLTHTEANRLKTKYTEAQIHEVCRLLKEDKLTYLDISDRTGVSLRMVKNIRSGRNWSDIASQYGLVKAK